MLDPKIALIKDPILRLVAFVKERQAILERRRANQPKPWTHDTILQRYRFSNMLREDDTVTQWIASHWRDPHGGDPNLWFAMTIARFINEPATLGEIGYPTVGDGWARQRFQDVIVDRQRKKLKVFNPAYMIAACNHQVPKVVHQLQVLDGLWNSRELLRPKTGDTLRSYHMLLGQFYGLGSFLSAQIIADLKYAKDSPLERASDWRTFAASGPGSRRGLCRIHGLPTEKWRSFSEDDFCLKLKRLMEVAIPRLRGTALYEAHAQDGQNWLCELDKFERARLGEGRPKQNYPGRA